MFMSHTTRPAQDAPAEPATSPATATAARSRSLSRIRRTLTPYGFLSPTGVLLIILMITPIIMVVSYSLLDGSTVRTPGVGVYLADAAQTNMENYGVQPDVFVENSPEDNLAGRDRELETAVQELIKQLDSKSPAKSTAPKPTTTSGPQGQP